jgi:anti-sigma factor RsiW
MVLHFAIRTSTFSRQRSSSEIHSCSDRLQREPTRSTRILKPLLTPSPPALLTVNRTRIRTAWFLLAAFVLGGVVGPTAHRIDHAAEPHALHPGDVVRSQSEKVETAASPNASPTLAVAGARQLDCELCATRVLVSDPASIDAPIAPRPTVAIVGGLPSPVHATTPATVLSRGPPTGA